MQHGGGLLLRLLRHEPTHDAYHVTDCRFSVEGDAPLHISGEVTRHAHDNGLRLPTSRRLAAFGMYNTHASNQLPLELCRLHHVHE